MAVPVPCPLSYNQYLEVPVHMNLKKYHVFGNHSGAVEVFLYVDKTILFGFDTMASTLIIYVILSCHVLSIVCFNDLWFECCLGETQESFADTIK